jgi:hypothetical protein
MIPTHIVPTEEEEEDQRKAANQDLPKHQGNI